MLIQDSSNVLEMQQVNDCSMLIPSHVKLVNHQRSVIVESLQQNNEMILQDKLCICESNSLKPKSSKILRADLTSKEKGLYPYWTELHEEISSRLWLPTKTVLQDLELNSSNILYRKTVENSWFSTRLNIAPSESFLKTCSPLFTSSLAGCTGSEGTVSKSKKIRIYPTNEQKSIFRKWFGTTRFVYNLTVGYLNKPKTKANWKKIKGGILESLPKWSEEIPYQIKSIAIRDACQAVSKAKKDYKKTKKIQKVRFRSRKNNFQSCYIPKSAIKSNGIYPRLTKGVIDRTEKLPKECCDSRLICDKGRWFISIPSKYKQLKPENQGRVVALDPGIRTFQTFFAETCCGKLGQSDFSKIQRLCSYLDKLVSKHKLEKKRLRKSKLQHAIQRMQFRIRNLTDELHHKVAVFLVKNFDIIVLPKFETSKMANRSHRKLRSKTVRSMLTFAHYRFSKFLEHKANEYSRLVLEQSEAWTSKTVSWTGEIVNNLGGSKVIRSKSTGLEMDRDYNGARGIFLRALGDQPILQRNLQNTSALNTSLVVFDSEK